MMFSPQQAAQWTGGVWDTTPAVNAFSAVTHDSRTVTSGALYVAIRGENQDGSIYVPAAAQMGAAAAIVPADATLPNAPIPLLRTPDTRLALANLAAAWRSLRNPFCIGITGSVGKTSVKDFLAHLLEPLGPVAKTNGNWNNEIGLPRSLLTIAPDTKNGVFECGTNHPGEIAALARILRPNAAILTAIAPCHIGNFGSEQAIAEEKANLLRSIPPSGFAVLPSQSPFFPLFQEACRHCTIVSTAVLSQNNPCTADFVAQVLDETIGSFAVCEKQTNLTYMVKTGVPGVHMIHNALLAIAAARIRGVLPEQITARIQSSPRAPMRWQIIEKNGIRYINDAYNANPASMKAALETFAKTPSQGRHVAVLGDMGELGDKSQELHRLVGTMAARIHPDLLLCIGPQSLQIANAAIEAGFPSSALLHYPEIPSELPLQSGDLLLLKASRFMKLERLLPPQ